MAAGSGGEKYIGKLMLDITDISTKAKKVDDTLKSLGAGAKIDLSKRFELNTSEIDKKVEAINKALASVGSNKGIKINIADEVKKQIDAIYKDLQDGAKRISDVAKSAVDSISKIGEAKATTSNNKALKETIADLRDYYSAMKQAAQARAEGNIANEKMFSDEAARKIENINTALLLQANSYRTVTAARMQYESTANKIEAKTSENEAKAIEKVNKELSNATQAYIKLIEARTKLNLTEVKYGRDSEEYAKAAYAVTKAREAFNQYSKDVRQAARSSQEATNAQEALNNVMSQTEAQQDQTNMLNRANDAYKQLSVAIREYNLAYKAKNQDNMQYWMNQANMQMGILNDIGKEIAMLDEDSAIRQQINSLIQQGATQQDAMARGVGTTVGQSGELEAQINGLVSRYLSLLAIIRAIKKVFSEMIDYVSEYSDKMNEIQIITGKSSDEIAVLGESYRRIAQEMSVSSLELADAAIYFTRQGLQTAEIEKRLKNVTMYAKTANVEFTEAAELMTAVINSMGLMEQEAEDGRNAAQRVADVFLVIGDNAATSGYEIGQAMQKAAASAGAFGVEFEWLAASIGAVSETTRQEARTIGTAFNTIIARLHQIKQSGYNSEDETKLNDVAKALAKIDVALMDQAGNWRDYQDIMTDVAGKWDELDDKTRSYIATTMAGVKQQNVFLAWMNDMSKSAEDGGRTWQLYEKALNSAGTASEKYAVYTDSVAAAQQRLTVAQEKLYSILDASIIKDITNLTAGWINSIAEGAKVTKNMNIIIPVVIGLITALAIAIKNADLVSKAFAMTWTKHPVLLTIAAITAGVVALVSAISAVSDAAENARERMEQADQALQETRERISKYTSLQEKSAEMFEELGKKTKITSEDLDKFSGTLEDISNLSPTARAAVEEFKNELKNTGEVAEATNRELEAIIENEHRIAVGEFAQKVGNITPETRESNASFLEYANYWDEKGWFGSIEDPKERFIQQFIWALAGDARSSGDFAPKATHRGKYLPEDIYDKYFNEFYIQKRNMDATGYNTGNIMYMLGERAWNEFMQSGQLESAQDGLYNDIAGYVNEAVDMLGYKLNDDEKSVLFDYIMEKLIGEDMEVSEQEYAAFGTRLSSIVNQMLGRWSDFNIPIADAAVTKKIAARIFEGFNFFDPNNPDMSLNDIIETQRGNIQQFVDSYYELIAQGFTDEDLRWYLQELPIDQWNNIMDIILQDMKDRLSEYYTDDEGNNLLENLFGDLWGDVDIETMKLINALTDAEVPIEKIIEATSKATSIDEFKEKLSGLADEMGVDVPAEAEEAQSAVENFSKQVKSAIGEIEDIDKVLEKIKNGETIDASDLLDIAELHPELMTLIGDAEQLEEALKGLKQQSFDQIIQDVTDMLLDNPIIAQNSPFASMLDEEYTSLRSLLDYEEDAINQYISQCVVMFLSSTGLIEQAGEDWAQSFVDGFFSESSVGMLNQEIIDLADMIQAGWENASTDRDQVFHSQFFNAGPGQSENGIQWNENVVISLTPITADGKILTPEELDNYIQELLAESSDIDELYANDADKEGILIRVAAVADNESFDDVQRRELGLIELLKYFYEMPGIKEAEEEVEKDIKSLISDLEKLDTIITKMHNGEPVSFSDILDLSKAHPEILGVIGDAAELDKALERIRKENADKTIGSIKNMILDSEEAMAASPFSQYISDEVKTLGDLYNDPAFQSDIDAFIDRSIAVLLTATGDMEAVGKEWATSLMESMFFNANMDLANRPVINASELAKAGWDNAGEGIATLFSSTYSLGDVTKGAELKWNQNVVVSLTPITPDGKVLTPQELNRYVENLMLESSDAEGLLTRDAVENGGLGLVIDISSVADDESFADAEAKMNGLMDALHKIHEYLYDEDPSEQSWLERQVDEANKAAEASWAQSNNYVEQIGQLQASLGFSDGWGEIDAAYDSWKTMDEGMRESIAETYPGVAKAMLEVERVMADSASTAEDYDEASRHLNAELNKASKLATAKYFQGTYSAIQKLEKGTISATDAYEAFNKELDLVVKAGEDITDVETKMADGAEVTASDVSNLANLLNISADTIIQDFPSAVAMFDELTGATGELQTAFDMLNKAAFLRITGTSEADFSAIQDGLISVQGMAQETIDMLIATGQWTVETMDLDTEAWVQTPNGWVKKFLKGAQQILKPTGNNPFKGRGKDIKNSSSDKGGKSGGGGGGGGGNRNEMTEVERMLDRMDQINAIREHQQSFYQAQKNYYSQTGQLQGVIGYSQREIDLLHEQSEELEGNIAKIEEYMAIKQKELDALTTSDDQYEEVADDLDKLQKAHQNYTKQLIENKTSVDELTKAIEEQRKKIRDMEINLRNTILKAIEDREKRNEKMFKAEIDMENTILDLITKRYEKERDQIIDNANMKINSLNEERSLLEEQLQLRRQQAEEEDKAKQLAQYEAQYQRILADPTRRKEALELDEKIRDLREEMAWDAAEKEVRAQQDSIDQQVESLEDYIEYVQNYYEDLFEHPQKLIDEMRDIMMMADEEIIAWLIANDEEYAKSTENTQQMMVQGWQATLDEMHDVIKTYWDEVEQIIAQGDEYIINFLKENSQDYREAGKLQAEAYVDEWKKQLDDLKKAYQAVATEAASTYSVIEKSGGSGKSGGGGGGGGGSSSTSNDNSKPVSDLHGYALVIDGKKFQNQGYASMDAAANAAQSVLSGYFVGARMSSDEIRRKQNEAAKTMVVYERGGIADYTGPAWLDGSPANPERILSPYQTKLFETMVSALESINRIAIPGMSNYSDLRIGGNGAVSVGDIIVNVDNLDTDDDYEDLANKVSEVLMERIGKTAAIGGLRIRSI